MTPHILLHSGIGPQAELTTVGVTPVVDHPNVGKNLHDHSLVVNNWKVDAEETRDRYYRDATLRADLLQDWLDYGTGEYLVDSALTHVGFFHLDASDPVFQLADDPAAGPNSAHWEIITNVSYPLFG
jgi:choline dehydrogenase-like flavoprotein